MNKVIEEIIRIESALKSLRGSTPVLAKQEINEALASLARGKSKLIEFHAADSRDGD